MEQQRIPLQLILNSYSCSVRAILKQTPLHKNSQQVNLPSSDKQNNLESIGESLSGIVLTKIQKRNELMI